MSRKGLLTNEIFHSLKERKIIFEGEALPTYDFSFNEFTEHIECAFWGFVPSHGTHQADSLLIMEEEMAPATPGSFYNPVTGRESIFLGPKKSNTLINTEGGERNNVK